MSIFSKLFGKPPLKSVFEDTPFVKTHSDIYALNIRGIENPQHFYLKNHEGLKSIKDKWRFKPKDNSGRCLYDYEIFFEEGGAYHAAMISFTCNSLIVNSHIYEIREEEILDLLIEDFSAFKSLKKSFPNRESGKEFLSKERANEKLILMERKLPKWLKFEGKFMATFDTHDHVDPSQRASLKNFEFAGKVFSQYLKKFGDEDEFSAICASYLGPNMGHVFAVHATQAFFEKLDGVEKFSWNTYTEFELELYYEE